jgi:hypothetical protein
MFIAPLSETTNGAPTLLKTQPLDEVIDELVPKDQRGTHVMDTILSGRCPASFVCTGTDEKYQRLSIHLRGNLDAYNFASIEWKHRKCQTPVSTKRAK